MLVNRATMTGTGQLPKFEDDAYAIARRRSLSHPDGRSAGHESLSRRDPRRRRCCRWAFVAYTPCFRARPDRRARTRAAFCARTSSTRSSSCATRRPRTRRSSSSCSRATPRPMLERLGLPYRVKLLAAGDTGFSLGDDVRSRGVGAGRRRVARGVVVQHLHRLPGAAREHSLPAGQGREAALRAHAERLGPRVSAHDRLHPRALPARRRHRRASPKCCGRISAPTGSAESHAPRQPGAARRRAPRAAARRRTSGTRSASSRDLRPRRTRSSRMYARVFRALGDTERGRGHAGAARSLAQHRRAGRAA